MDPKKEAENIYSEVELEDNAEAESVPALVPVETPAPEPEKESEEEDEKETETETEILTPETKPEPVSRKRSIYQDLKDKKNEVKTERELREAAERERDEALAKLNNTDKADDIDAFAQEIDANPESLRKLKELFLKDVPKGELSPEMAAQLKEFQEFQAQNREAIDKVQFDKEFEQAVPAIKSLFGEASAEETNLIKNKLNELAHTEQFHDKELDYIAFKNQEVLKALVSPKKRGLEPKGRTDATNVATDFNPNADIASLSEKESIAWEKAYKEAAQTEGLAQDSLGRKIFI